MANRIGRLSTAAAIWLLCFSLQTASAQTRVALVSTCGGEAGQNVLVLADVALSADTNVVLVERREVERVLQEQNLMHCGLSEAGQAVAAGQLLGVQVFASLETVPDQKEALGLVVFDAATGVVLWDSVLSGTNVEVAAVEVDAAVEAGCEKRQRPAGSLTRLCILSVRNVDLPRQFDSSCQSVGSILQRQLVQSPSLAVLERQHLENVNKERLLPAGVQTNQLLPSLVLIELDISRNGATNGLSGTAILSDTAGTKLGQVAATVDSENPADLSDRLLIELERFLKATPSQIVVDRAREAGRFCREATFLLNSGKLADGLRALEAAAALVPTNMQYQGSLAMWLGEAAADQIHNLGDSLDLAGRALEISRAFHEQAISRTGTTTDGPERWLIGGRFWNAAQLKFQELDPDIKNRVLEFQRQLRELVLGVVELHARAGVKDPHSFEAYTELLRWRLCDLEKLAPLSSVWTADTLDCLQSWLRMAEKFSRDGNGVPPISTRMLLRLCYQAKAPWGWELLKTSGAKESGHLPLTPHINNWKLQTEDYARFDELFHEMEHHPDPVVAAYGLVGELSSKVRDASTADDIDQGYRRAKDFIRQQISEPRRGPATQYRGLLYNAAIDLIDLLPDPQTRHREQQELFEFMLERKEIEYWVTRKAVDPHPYLHQQYHPQFARGGTIDSFDTFDTSPHAVDPHAPDDDARLITNAKRVLTLLRSGECHDLDTARFCSATGSFERELVTLRPELKTEMGAAPSAPWESSKLLFRASGQVSSKSPIFKDGWIVSVGTDSNDFYVVLFGKRLQVVRVPMDGSEPVTVGEALYKSHNNLGRPFVTIPAIGDQAVFVGTDVGIFELPLNGGTGRHITTAEGLPTDHVSSLAWLDGKLYAGLAGGYLVSYDLQTSQCRVLASSQRRDARSGLDNVSPPTQIEFMMADPDRHRILFTVSLGLTFSCAPQLGLWQIDTATGKLTQLVRLYAPPWWASLMGDGTMLIRIYGGDTEACGGAWCGVVSYELATGHTRFLSVCDEKQRPAGPGIPVAEGALRLPVPALPPHILVDGWMWFANGRVSTNATDLEHFPESEETYGNLLDMWKSFHLLRDRGQMAIANPHGIWLLNLKKHEASEDASKDSP
jgi:hypothetical protein